eukprot:SM000052S17737  [mRNA]  locus=s52:428610:431364:+ [translate_table: standard]
MAATAAVAGTAGTGSAGPCRPNAVATPPSQSRPLRLAMGCLQGAPSELVAAWQGGVHPRWRASPRSARASAAPLRTAVAAVRKEVDVAALNKEARLARLDHLEAQAMDVLRQTVASFEHPTFPCALITGDVVILDLLSKLGAFKDKSVKVVFIDTFHLFPETHKFLEECENRYGFKSEVFHVDGVADKDEYVDKYGSDLFIRDIDEYDKLCKVEPFGRALKVDAMINGRRRDHGQERAHLECFEEGKMAKVQPLAYWEFRDCWDYIDKYQIPYHPLHDEGYPSIGDIHSTLPVPKDKWFEYGGERSGRFQGLKNKDGSEKTECGIHVGDPVAVAKV